MPDYRVQARKRMKRGLHPALVAAKEAAQAQTGALLTNTSGNARQGQQYRVAHEGGHDVHVYADGTRVGIAPRVDTHLAPGRRTGFGQSQAPQSGFAPNTGQAPTYRPAAPGNYSSDLAALGAAQTAKRTIAPTQPVEGTGQRHEAELQALAKQRQMMNAKTGAARVPKTPAPGAQAQIVRHLKALGFNPRRRNRRRLTGGMLAP